MLILTSSLMLFVTFLASILVQVFIFPFLYLGDLINHPQFYLSLLVLALLFWCFGNDSQA